MTRNVPVITKMTFHEVSSPGYAVHMWTEKDGEMDVVLTIPQYHKIHAQLSEHGRATLPTGEAA